MTDTPLVRAFLTEAQAAALYQLGVLKQPRSCPHCGQRFAPVWDAENYCSDECGHAHVAAVTEAEQA